VSGQCVPEEGNVGKANDTVDDTTDNPSEWYETCCQYGKRGGASLLSDVTMYVRTELFPKLKFIMSPHQLQYSSEETSICYQICCGIGVVDNQRSRGWEAYKSKILETLNTK